MLSASCTRRWWYKYSPTNSQARVFAGSAICAGVYLSGSIKCDAAALSSNGEEDRTTLPESILRTGFSDASKKPRWTLLGVAFRSYTAAGFWAAAPVPIKSTNRLSVEILVVTIGLLLQ